MCSYKCRLNQYQNREYNKSSRLASIIAKPDQWQQKLTLVVHVQTVSYASHWVLHVVHNIPYSVLASQYILGLYPIYYTGRIIIV
jgi:hypothetical protein